jgi:hypothetical protein
MRAFPNIPEADLNAKFEASLIRIPGIPNFTN